MDYNPNDLQFGDQYFKFTRVKQGYNPEEVDTVIDTKQRRIDTLIRQNEDLTNENSRLTEVLNECNEKIRQLAQSTELMEQERQKEKLRLADIMTTAGRTAEEMVADARRKAAEIIADANMAAGELMRQADKNAKESRNELASLIRIIRTTRESSNLHYDKLDEVLQGAIDMLDV